MAVRNTALMTIALPIALAEPAQAASGVYKPDYPLVHDCIVSIQTARPEVMMTEQMFLAVMECEAFEADLTQAEAEDEGAPLNGEPSSGQ